MIYLDMTTFTYERTGLCEVSAMVRTKAGGDILANLSIGTRLDPTEAKYVAVNGASDLEKMYGVVGATVVTRFFEEFIPMRKAG